VDIAAITAGDHAHSFLAAIGRYGYLAVFAFIGVQDLGLPTLIPGCVVLLFAGYLASTGALNPVAAGLVAVFGALLGASVLFGLARLGGETLFRRFGRFFRITPEQHAKLERLLRRWGLPAWLLIRFLPGLRAATTLVAGFGGMRYRSFALLTAAASAIWAYAFVLLGLALGRNWRLAAHVAVVGGPIALVVVLVLVGVALLVRARRARSKRELLIIVSRWTSGQRARLLNRAGRLWHEQ
jgi:membrane protein DedA with SNARE-associated domain